MVPPRAYSPTAFSAVTAERTSAQRPTGSPVLAERGCVLTRPRSGGRDDGSHFDPWLRLHERLGGRIVAPAPASMTIEAPVADWEEWTGVAMPDDGDYLIPGGLAPVEVRDGVGRHVEPNVWLVHEPMP